MEKMLKEEEKNALVLDEKGCFFHIILFMDAMWIEDLVTACLTTQKPSRAAAMRLQCVALDSVLILRLKFSVLHGS